eukprot:TRINITY_DN93_c0_g1_i1.p1 TRINITY_DN93_c0_g1~~TRINITY_DN93_c0_g1_i1.p1  ORF type:complete len:1696 (+),score=117.78 TRINITY_DN93_c0_g1_i1:149-5236(+)
MVKIFWWLLLLFAVSLCQQQQEQEITLGTVTDSKTLSDGQAHYYQVTIPSEVPEHSQYLVFDASSPDDELSDPDIYISKSTPYPSISTNDWRCQAYGQDICVIPKETIAPNVTFHATIYCQKKCTYKLNVALRDEVVLDEGNRVSDTLPASESRLYRFTVPPDSNIRSISVTLNVEAQNTSSVRMFVTKVEDETTLPSSDNSIRVLPTWLGLIARAYEDESAWFCTNCSYKVLITTKEDTGYTLTFTTSKLYSKVKKENEEIFDMVRARERNCYQYKMRDLDKDLEIHLTPFSGDPNLYINPGELPLDMTDFAYNTKGTLEESLVLTSREIRKHSAPKNAYYICVFGETSSAYHLIITAQEQEGTRKYPLTCGYTHTMTIAAGELMLFSYPLPSEEVTNLTLSLVSITGDADLYVKQCAIETDEFGEEKGKCNLRKSDFYDSDVLRSTNSSSVDLIRVASDPTLCNGLKSCSFLIGVYGVQETRFSLTASCDNKRQIALPEGSPYHGWVELGKSSYFAFSVDNHLASSIKIQLTSMSGDADLYVSRNNPFCDANHAEYVSNLEAYLPDTVIYTKERDGPLNTTYYVSVYGTTHALYALTYTIGYENDVITPISIYDGNPTIGTLNGTEPALYKFTVDFAEEAQHDIKIFVSVIHGAVNAYVAAGYPPTSQNYTWTFQPFDSAIYIRTSDNGYSRNGTYYVLITKYDTEDQSTHLFSIKYLTGIYTATLLEGYPEIGNITQDSSEFYKYYIHNFGDTITVTVTPFVGDPDLYISVSSSNKLPTKYESDYYSNGVGADSIQISRDSLKDPLCKSQTQESSRCVIYITVHCVTQECSYTLQVGQTGELPLRLIEGLPQFGTVYENKPQFYIVVPEALSETSDAVISVRPKLGRVKAYALLINGGSSLRPATDKKDLPGPDKFDVASFDRANSQVIVIKRENLDNCGSLCQYYIGVYHDPDADMDATTKSEYTIAATSNFLQLVDGQSIIDFVPSKTYKYYRFRVPCVDCTISIALTPLSDGDPDLYVNKGSYKLPSLEDFDFRSILYRGDFLQLSPSHPFFSENNQPISGTYSIAVYSEKNCTYSLVALTSTEVVEKLFQGIPVRHEQETGRIKYFTFSSWKKADIKISLAIHSGRAILRANVVENPRESNIMENLPTTEQTSTWSSQNANTNGYLMLNKNSEGFIPNGTYIVAVESLESTSYDISVEYQSDKEYSLIKIGEPMHITMSANSEKMLGFVVENKEDMTVSLSTFYGSVNAKIAVNETNNFHWDLPENGQILIKASENANFHLGMYYVLLKATYDSELTVMVEQSSQPIMLSEGRHYSGSMTCGTPLYFLYNLPRVQKNEKATKTKFNVYVKFYDPVLDATLYIREVSKTDKAMPREWNSQYSIKYDQQIGYLGDTINVTSNGKTLALGLDAQFAGVVGSEKCVKFEIVVWTTGIVTMIPDAAYMNGFAAPGDLHIYELPVSKPSTVHVEATPCLGEIEFFVTQSLVGINDRKYDIKKTELNKGRLFGSFVAQKGVYYIAVKGVAMSYADIKSATGIWYSLRAITSDKQDINEIEDYVLENHGNIHYTVSGPDITLTWGNVLRRDQGRSKVGEVTYDLYMGEEGKANMFTACGIKFSAAEQIATGIKGNSFSYKTKQELAGKRLIFNVVAHIPEYGQTVTYNPMFFQPVPPRKSRYIFCTTISITTMQGD